MLAKNLLLSTDSYKHTHHRQYPPETTRVYSYIESRGGQWPSTLFFGLQIFLKTTMAQRITHSDVVYANVLCNKHFGRNDVFNREGWDYIVDRHEGRLPVSIKALAEGTLIPTRNALVTIENTDPRCAWLTSFLETALHRAVWYPTTVATKSHVCKQHILAALERTCDTPAEAVKFALHDFGARGVSSGESAGIGGCAHLVNFLGTDTMEALEVAREFYGADMAAFSIPAMEHSTVTAWGREREREAYLNMLQQYGTKGGMLAMVMDSYDLFRAVCLLGEIKDDVIASGARVVVRPDSGDAAEILPVVLRLLAADFGTERNQKGFHVLHPSVRTIWGDGIDDDSIPGILSAVERAGFSTENVAFGMGGGLLQKLDRDTLQFAMKCSWAETDRGPTDVYKEPATDMAKASKRGRFSVVRGKTVPEQPPGWVDNGFTDELREVYRDGRLFHQTTLDEVRARAEKI